MVSLTIQQQLKLALQHHQAGRLPEAERLYRQILAEEPEHPDALHLMGALALQTGRHDLAVDLIQRVIALMPDFPDAHFNLGNALKAKGQLGNSIAAYRQAVTLDPDYAEAYNNLGIALKENGQLNDSIAAYQQAIALDPEYANAHNNLGIALKDNGQIDEAITAFSQSIALNPNFAEAHNNLGGALRDKGQLEEAIAQYRLALAIRPNYADALNNLGIALKDNGQLDEAVAAFSQSIALNPNFAEAHNNLGVATKDKGQLQEAIARFRQAIAIKPNYPEAHNILGIALKEKGELDNALAAFRMAISLRPTYTEAHSNLGVTLRDEGQPDESIAALRLAISLRPNLAEAHNNLGMALKDKGFLDEAAAAHAQAIALDPLLPEAHNNLGNVLREKGQITEAIAAFRQAVNIKPDYAEAHSNLVFTVLYDPASDPRIVAEEHLRWGQQHGDPLHKFVSIHSATNRDPNRRLKIGYVSPDFREHVVGGNMLPILKQHNHREFEVYCYSNVSQPDQLTEQFKSVADVWRPITGLSDEAAAEIIRTDGIDILIDLSGHTAKNRLLIFARKPAPIQMSYLGYNDGTALQTMDYRISDHFLDNPESERNYREKTIYLPHCYWCYRPGKATTDPAPPPEISSGFITFGSLCNFAKISEPARDLWARVLLEVKNSHLLLAAHPGDHCQKAADRFASHGVDPDRIEFIGRQNWNAYIATFGRIDIALDPIPYNGGISTCDALWMGVPVVTLVGDRAVGRAGKSILMNLNLPELIAKTPDEFVAIAVRLANDRPRRENLRRNLRQMMIDSPITNTAQFTADLESLYRQAWRKWCAT
jgi:predicted O-linked N-acetylglucosamine transferase (SPINDLY family)